jgi:hypothetical protein
MALDFSQLTFEMLPVFPNKCLRIAIETRDLAAKFMIAQGELT